MGGVMDRSAILAAARQAIVVDRAATHGAAEASFAAIAGGWNWWLGRDGQAGAARPLDGPPGGRFAPECAPHSSLLRTGAGGQGPARVLLVRSSGARA